MSPQVEFITYLLSLLTILADLLIVLLVYLLIMRRLGKSSDFGERVLLKFGRYGLVLAFVVALGSTLSSLFYSEIAGFLPCSLCWWQRIFLYPQLFILGAALYLKDKTVGIYSVVLSAIGAAIAAYHTYLQFGGLPLIPCAVNPGVVSCSQRYFLEFGYVTIPTMALTGFVLIIILVATAEVFNKAHGLSNSK